MIIGLDPSLTCTGYILFTDSGLVLDCGAVRTEPSKASTRIYQAEDDARRVRELVRALDSLRIPWGVSSIRIAVEQPGGCQSARALGALKLVQGAIASWITCHESVDVDVRWIWPLDVKKAMCATKVASKDQIVAEAERRGVTLAGRPKPVREAIADAYGVALASGWIARKSGGPGCSP